MLQTLRHCRRCAKRRHNAAPLPATKKTTLHQPLHHCTFFVSAYMEIFIFAAAKRRKFVILSKTTFETTRKQELYLVNTKSLSTAELANFCSLKSTNESLFLVVISYHMYMYDTYSVWCESVSSWKSSVKRISVTITSEIRTIGLLAVCI